jgi:hypothetical protein
MDALQELLLSGKLTEDEELTLLQAIIDRERMRHGIQPGVRLQMTTPVFAIRDSQ